MYRGAVVEVESDAIVGDVAPGSARARPAATWFDRLIGLFEGRSIPWWALILLVYVAIAGAVSAVLWIEGPRSANWLLVPIIGSVYPPFGLFILLSVRRSAARALKRFQPALAGVDAARVAGFERRLTGMTNPRFGVSLLIGVAVAALTGASGAPSGTESPSAAITIGTVVVAVDGALGYGIGVVAVVFIISVLATIPDVHRAATTIDVRRPDPAHAFASVTALAGVLLLLLVTFSALTDPRTFETVSLVLAGVVVMVAVVAFVAPLVGMRQRLEDQKEQLLGESLARIEAVEAELERAVEARELERIGPLTEALNAYYNRRDRIASASTLPWDTTTFRGFVTVLLVPIVIWFITSVLGRTLFNA